MATPFDKLRMAESGHPSTSSGWRKFVIPTNVEGSDRFEPADLYFRIESLVDPCNAGEAAISGFRRRVRGSM